MGGTFFMWTDCQGRFLHLLRQPCAGMVVLGADNVPALLEQAAMRSPHNRNETVLDHKTRVIIDAISTMSAAQDENELLLQAGLAIQDLEYPDAMFSFIRPSNGGQHIVAEEGLATGEKFKAAARVTDRPFPGPDLLAKVLERRRPRFIPDSRTDEENARELCRSLGIVTQYVVPLFTPTVQIGTLQVLMHEAAQAPRDECRILDALATHLSIGIERVRVNEQLAVAYDDLMRQTKKIVHAERALVTVHGLSVPSRELVKEMEDALTNVDLRSNRTALTLLDHFRETVEGWRGKVAAALEPADSTERTRAENVLPIVKHTVEVWWRTGKRRNCSLRTDKNAVDARVCLAPSDLMEALSCLISNSIDAHAREVVASAKLINDPPAGSIEISIQDDGDGIPEVVKQAVLKYGYTSKKTGHGMGLVIVSLLVDKMGGRFAFTKWGKCSGEPHTVAVIQLPLSSPMHSGVR